MLHSKIEQILKENIASNEELAGTEHKFHAVEYEIDNMANKSDADFDRIIHRAKELIQRVFDGHRGWLDGRWPSIEKDIEENLKDLKR
jgi:hypothetical protein